MRIIYIEKENLIRLTNILNNLRVPLIRNHNKIDSLINKKIKGLITEEEYNNGYKEIVVECKNKLSDFKTNFIQLYILNEINKKLNSSSIILYNNIDFDKIILGIDYGLKLSTIPVNILNEIIEFDCSNIIEEISKINFEIKMDDNLSSLEKNNINLINTSIKKQRETNKKCMIKEKKM